MIVDFLHNLTLSPLILSKMINTRAFVGGRATNALSNVCEEVGVRVEIMQEATFELVRTIAEEHDDLNEYDAIRQVYSDLKDSINIRSHLADQQLCMVSKVLADPNRGKRASGRPRKLTIEQEQTIIDYVR